MTNTRILPSVRNFLLTIQDKDGETHEYKFTSPNPWRIMQFVAHSMDVHGDFFGHVLDQTMNVRCNELVPDADMTGALKIN